MRLEKLDITIIKELLEDYQYYVNNYPSFLAEVTGQIVSPRKVYPWVSLQAKLDHYGTMVGKALSGEHPQGFILAKTLDDQWMAWSSLSFFGPTTEFQARLRGFQQGYLQQAIEDSWKVLDHKVVDELELADDKVSVWANIWKDVFDGLRKSIAENKQFIPQGLHRIMQGYPSVFESTPKPENPFYRLLSGDITDNLIDELWDRPEREGRE